MTKPTIESVLATKLERQKNKITKHEKRQELYATFKVVRDDEGKFQVARRESEAGGDVPVDTGGARKKRKRRGKKGGGKRSATFSDGATREPLVSDGIHRPDGGTGALHFELKA